MQPVAGQFFTRHRFHNGDIVIVVPVKVVYAPAEYVQGIAQGFRNHGWVLHVPGRPPPAYLSVPANLIACLAPVPEDEIAKVPSEPRIGVPLEPLPGFGPFAHVQLKQFAETLEFERIEEDVGFVAVGITFLDQLADQVNGLLDAGG